MEIPQDKVPTNLNEAIGMLTESLTDEELAVIKNKSSSSNQFHSSIGMNIRNEWSLWDKGTILVNWFKKTYGIEHADDISGIILECLWNDIRKEKRRDVILAMRYKAHWEEMKKQDKDYD